MQVIVNRNALADVLVVASGIASARTTKDVLKCVRLTATEGELLIGSTDLEVALRCSVRQVEVRKPGDILVPADKLTQIARESVDETLTIGVEDQVCHVRGVDSHFEVYGQDPNEFPPVPDLEGEPDAEVAVEVLCRLIDQTSFAVAKENTRYAINGVLWEKKNKRLCFVATDGRRLARAVGAAEQAGSGDASMIVPAKTIHVLQRVLANGEGQAAIRFSDNQVIVKCNGYVVSSALVEGQFPNYDEVIPKDNDKSIELSTEAFISAVRRAALLTNEQSKGVRLSFTQDKLVLSSRAPEQGEATISMRAGYGGENVDIGFNPNFILDALRVVGTPTVNFEMKETNRPGVLKAGSEFMYVVMPVSLA
ncbi:MAG: DNA polymerase III subunit beta [Phycisphaerales bacterium]|nr:DNA polymerase III subunit beta [Phycisphaerales bacterium]